MKRFQQAKLDLPPVKEFVKNLMRDHNLTRGEAKGQYNRLKKDIVYINDQYQVNIDPHPPNGFHPQLVHMSIKRIDREVIHDWRDLQEIKNMLMGEEAEAVELYPAESRLVDSANQFHLWVVPPGQRFPFGFTERGVTSDEFHSVGSGTKQRPINGEGA